MHAILSTTIWYNRLAGVGVIDQSTVSDLGFSGVVARAAGCVMDERLTGYESYGGVHWSVAFGGIGDSEDRYLIRLHEMVNSCRIIQQCLASVSERSSSIVDGELASGKLLSTHYGRMEEMIHSFKFQSEGGTVQPTRGAGPQPSRYTGGTKVIVFSSQVECPKGIYSALLEASPLTPDRPYRLAVAPNDFLTVSYLDKYTRNMNLPDAIAVLGSVDFVLGSVDKKC